MMQLLTAFILLFASQQTPSYPQFNPMTDEHRTEWQRAYKQWKPGPKVAAEVKRLNQRESDLATSHARGDISIEAMTVELQRLEIQRHLTLCVALVAARRIPGTGCCSRQPAGDNARLSIGQTACRSVIAESNLSDRTRRQTASALSHDIPLGRG